MLEVSYKLLVILLFTGICILNSMTEINFYSPLNHKCHNIGYATCLKLMMYVIVQCTYVILPHDYSHEMIIPISNCWRRRLCTTWRLPGTRYSETARCRFLERMQGTLQG